MPSIGYFSFFAISFALLAFIHLRFPSKVKRVFDSLASSFGTSKYMNGYGESYYRMVGGIFATCAVLMAIGALFSAAE
jgi:hypothetical protein